MKFFVVLLAAGQGSRFGADIPKTFVSLEGAPLWMAPYKVFRAQSWVSRVVLTVPPQYLSDSSLVALKQHNDMVIAGGDTRRASVDNALSAIASQLTVEEKSKSFVLIHDAARAFVTADILTRTKDAVVKHSAVTTAIPSTDSLVMVDPVTLRVERSLPRQKMYRVQTPQAFRFDLIEQAHRTYKGNPTDDASMVEPLHPIHVVLGDESNIKVTYRADLSTAP